MKYVDKDKFKEEYILSYNQDEATDNLKDIFEHMVVTIVNKILFNNKDLIIRYITILICDYYWRKFNFNRIDERRNIIFEYFSEVIKREILRIINDDRILERIRIFELQELRKKKLIKINETVF